MRKAVFLDRDGTLIEEKHYLSNPDDVFLLSGVTEGLKLFASSGFILIIVSNQSGIGRGYFSLQDLQAVNERLSSLLLKEGVNLSAIYYCPHLPQDDCECRKPKRALIDRAQKEFDIDLEHSYVIGDKASDIELAVNCGMGSVLVRSGYGSSEEQMIRNKFPSVLVFDTLLEAAGDICPL